MNKKIVDLIASDDGTYVTKNDKKLVVKGMNKEIKNSTKKKYNREKVDNLLSGLDAGLDFVEDVKIRVDRFLRLRG